MAKWADFCVVRVKYGRERSSIVEVEVRPDTGEALGAARYMSRQNVVDAHARGTTFVTAPLRDGKYVRGEDVHVVEIHGEYFLRTDRNRTKADNLGSLPEYT